jgi:hypothetical protein
VLQPWGAKIGLPQINLKLKIRMLNLAATVKSALLELLSMLFWRWGIPPTCYRAYPIIPFFPDLGSLPARHLGKEPLHSEPGTEDPDYCRRIVAWLGSARVALPGTEWVGTGAGNRNLLRG